MEVLWAPWRMEYILGPKPDSCPFCLPQSTEEDEARKVLYRGKKAFVIMNIYPYNNGHLMVCPYRHLSQIVDLTADELQEVMTLVQSSARILQECMHPQGLNIGLNLGEAAGAGIREHLHFHLVPRWVGDSSFMAVMSETRMVPQHLVDTYNSLRPYFDKL